MAKAKKKNTGKNNASVLILALVLVLLFGILSVLLFPQVYGRRSAGGNTTNISIPVVKSTLRSADGEYHSIQTKFTLAFDKNKTGSLSSQKLYEQIDDIMSNLEYDKMSGSEGILYVKEQVKEGLTEYIDDIEILQDIYITAMKNDNGVMAGADDAFKDDSRDTMFRSLFDKVN